MLTSFLSTSSMIDVEQRILIDTEIKAGESVYLKQLTIETGNGVFYKFTDYSKVYTTVPSHHKRWRFFERRPSTFGIGVAVGVLCAKSKMSKHRLLEKIDNPIWKEILEKELL